jgi:hypothetical protein
MPTSFFSPHTSVVGRSAGRGGRPGRLPGAQARGGGAPGGDGGSPPGV